MKKMLKIMGILLLIPIIGIFVLELMYNEDFKVIDSTMPRAWWNKGK